MFPPDLLQQARRLSLTTRRRVDTRLAGLYRSVFRGQGMEFEEVRPYAAGDDVRSIDWNVTARADEPYVKQFREEREMAVWVVVDVSASMGFGTRHESKAATATRAAAVFTFAAIASRDRVGLATFGDAVRTFLPPRKGRRHGTRVVRDLLAAGTAEWAGSEAPAEGATDLAGALERVRRGARHRAVIFVVADFLGLAPGGPDARALRRLSLAHEVVPVVITDPAERRLVDVGPVRVRDPETGLTGWIDTGRPAVRRAYADAAARADAERDAVFRSLRLRPLPLATGSDVFPPIRTYLLRLERGAT